jgi:hypothetical protein
MTTMVTSEGSAWPDSSLDQRFRARRSIPFPFPLLQGVTVYTEYPSGPAVYTCDDTSVRWLADN